VTHRGATEIVIYGRRSVLEALASDRVDPIEVVVSRTTPKPFRKELAAACRERGVIPAEADGRAVAQRSGDARNDQGVVAAVRLLGVTEVEDFLHTLKGDRAKRPARILALDTITNPQNVGMIVRSVVAAGFDGLLWPTTGAPWISGLVIKASAGAAYRCGIVRCDTLAEGLWTLKRGGFTVAGLAADAEESVWAHEPAHRACYVMGGETTGISPEVADTLDTRLSIPMAGEMESLNVAVAAGVLCMALTRRTFG